MTEEPEAQRESVSVPLVAAAVIDDIDTLERLRAPLTLLSTVAPAPA